MRHAASIGLATRPLRLELDEISQLQLPAILHWNLNHFVVLKEIKCDWRGKKLLVIHDPGVGRRILRLEDISKHFTGVALECTPRPDFEIKDEVRDIPVSELTGRVRGIRAAVAKIIILAIALELFAIATPLFNQFVIDEVIVNGDQSLLQILVIGFALMLMCQTFIGLARSWFLMRWSLDIGVQWTTRILFHLVRLPLSFFESRHLGDVVSRFSSVTQIQNTLTSLYVESLLDGFMAIFALAMMLMYSWQLSMIGLLAVLSYSCLRWIFYAPLREASQERLILSAKENSHFLETIRAIAPLKLFGRETERLAKWQNLKQDVVNRDVRTQKLGLIFKSLNSTISGAQNLAVIYVGASLIMEHKLTIGMLTAFTSYLNNFSGRIFSLIDVYINLKMLNLHTRRIGEIVTEKVEIENFVERNIERTPASVTLKNIKFRYGEGEPWILDGIDLHIPAGESVALTGPSGCGKTTLCKIILGLIRPTEGDVLIGDTNINEIGVSAYRQLVGTVMQDDMLLAGSILENISFFDGRGDSLHVENCAKLAAIHSDIINMPMGYQTLVGDMGSSLSGGQKQRILLARALYKSPIILALDEATSHLDVSNEQAVNRALADLKLTRLMIAHRPETIRSANRVIELSNGKIVESKLHFPEIVS
jgi:ATP-binding cassette subfamily B protein RaxB